MEKIDYSVRRQLKLILGVPGNCSNSYLYTPRSKGGCGLKCIGDEYIVQTITHAFRMLTCRDNTISGIAKFSLISSTARIIHILPWLNLCHGLTQHAETLEAVLGGTRYGRLFAWDSNYIAL